jgi:hypothetical protein
MCHAILMVSGHAGENIPPRRLTLHKQLSYNEANCIAPLSGMEGLNGCAPCQQYAEQGQAILVGTALKKPVSA